jgi:hypothetical protein
VALPLTLVYPTISLSRVSHYLSLVFKTFFLGPRISLTSSLLPMGFFLFHVHQSMGLSYIIHEHVSSHTLVHGNPVHLYHPWEPCIVSFFFELAPIGNSLLLGLFSKIVVWDLLDLPCVMYTCVGSKYMHLVLATLLHTIMVSNTICWGDNTLGSL